MKVFPGSYKLLTLILLASFLIRARGQEPIRVSDTEASSHLLAHQEPVYPPIAKVAHVHGTVILDVGISATGRVIDATVIDGPAMLQAAAMDAVKSWRYKPFEEGKGQPVRTYVSLPFGVLKSADEAADQADRSVGKEYFPLDDACRKGLAKPDEATVDTCRKEVEVALRFPVPEQRYLEIWGAHLELGRALLGVDRPAEAKAEFEAAFSIAQRRIKKTEDDYAYTVFYRGVAEQKLGETDAALADYTQADESMRGAIKSLPGMAKQYGFTLKQMLRQHAALLKQLDRGSEAAKLLAEADLVQTP